MTTKVRVGLFLTFLLAFGACSRDHDTSEFAERGAGVDAGVELGCAVDEDGDGFGLGCPKGSDCNDQDPKKHNECGPCELEAEGCACPLNAAPVVCYDATLPRADTLLCHTGMRYCRDGAWTACEGLVTFEVNVERRREKAAARQRNLGNTASALLQPNGICSACKPYCNELEDPLAPGPDALTPSNSKDIEPGPNGGITVESTPHEQVINNTTTCIPNQCTMASDQTICDDDCDGIPNAYDPAVGKPFGTTATAIFLDLAPGETGDATLNLNYYVRTADVYFLLDAGASMSPMIQRLYTDMQSGSFLSNTTTDCADTDRDGVVSAAENALKTEGIAGNIVCRLRDGNVGMGWFRDIPFSGVGNYRRLDALACATGANAGQSCTVGTALADCGDANACTAATWGSSISELTFGSTPTRSISNEVYYEHRVDMTSSSSLLSTIMTQVFTEGDDETSDPNPGSHLMALYAMATGKEVYLGWDRPGLPGYRAGVDPDPTDPKYTRRPTCGGGTWGYPCFRDTAFPIVVLVTDSTMHNGPDTDTTVSDPYAEVVSQVHAGQAWSDGKHHYRIPLVVRDSTTANELSNLPFEGNDKETDAEPVGTLGTTNLVTYVGNTRGMESDLNATSATCAGLQTASGPDAFYTFSVSQDMEMTVSARGTRFPVALGIYTNFNELVNGGGLSWTDGANVSLDDPNYFSVADEVATIQQPLPAGVNKIITDTVAATEGSLSRDVASVECYAGANDSKKGDSCDPNAQGSCDFGSDMLFKFNVAEQMDLKIDLSSGSNMSLTLFDAEPQIPQTLEIADGTTTIDLTDKALNAWRFHDENSTEYGPGAFRLVGVDSLDQDANSSLSPSEQPMDTIGQTAWIADAAFNNYSSTTKCVSKTSTTPFSGGTSPGWKVDFTIEEDPADPSKLYPIAIEGTGLGKRLAVSDGGNDGAPVSYAIGIVSTGSSTSLSTTYSETAVETCEDQTSVCYVDLSNETNFPTTTGFAQVSANFDNATPQARFTVDIPGTWQDNATGSNVCSGSAASGYDMVYKLTTGASAATVDIASKAPVSHLSLHDSSFATAIATASQETINITATNPSILIYNNVNLASNPLHDTSVLGVGYSLDTTAANQSLAVTLDTAIDQSVTVGLPGTVTVAVPPYPSADVTSSGYTGATDATDTAVATASAGSSAETSGSAPASDFTASLSTTTSASAAASSVTAGTKTLPYSSGGAKPKDDLSNTGFDIGTLGNYSFRVSGNTGGRTDAATSSQGDLDIGAWGSCTGGGTTPDQVSKFTLAAGTWLVRTTVAADAASSLRVAIFTLSGSTYTNAFGSCLSAGQNKTIKLTPSATTTYYLGFTSSSANTGSVSFGTGVDITAEDSVLTSAIDGKTVTFSGSTANVRSVADHARCASGSNRDRVHTFTVTNSRPAIITNNPDGTAAGAVAALYEWDTTTEAISTASPTALACLSDGSAATVNLTSGKTYGLVTYSATSGTGSVTYKVSIEQPPPATDPYVLTNTKAGCTTSSAVQNLVGSALCNDSVTFTGSTGGASTTGIASIPSCAATGSADVVHVFSIPGTTGTTPSGLNPSGYDNLVTLTNSTVSPGGFTSVAMIYASNSTGTSLSGSALVPLGATSSTACASTGSTQTYRLKNSGASAAYYAVVVTRASGATSDGKYSVTLTSGYSDKSGAATTDTVGETQTTTASAVTLSGHTTFSGSTGNYRSSDVSFPSGCGFSNTPANGGTSTRGRDTLRPFKLTSRSYVRLKNTSSSGTSVAGIFDSTGTTSVSPVSGSNCVAPGAGATYDLPAATYMLAVSDTTTGASGSSFTVDLSAIEIYPVASTTTPTDVSTQGNNHVAFNGYTSGRLADGSSADVWQVFKVASGFDNTVRIYNKGSSSDGFVASANLYIFNSGVLGSVVSQTSGSTSAIAEGSTGTYHLKGSTATTYAVVINNSGSGALSEGAYAVEVIAGNSAEGEETYSSATPFTLNLTKETVLNGSTAGRSMDKAIVGCTGGNVAQMDIAHRFKVASDHTVTITNSSGSSNLRAYLFDSSGNAVAASGTQCMTTTSGTNSATYGLLASESYYELVVTSATADASGQYEIHILPAGLGTSTEFRTVDASLEFEPSNSSLNVVKVNGDTTGNSADFARTGWDCSGVAAGSDRDAVVYFTVPAGFDDVITIYNQSNGVSFQPAMALYSPTNALLSSTAGATCISEGSTAGYKIKTGGTAQTYSLVVSNGGSSSGDAGTYAIRINGSGGSTAGESGSLSLSAFNIDGEYYQVTGDTALAGVTYDLSTLCGAGYNGKQGDLVRSFTVGTTQDVTIYNNSSLFGGATVLVMNSGSTTTKATGWGCIGAGSSATASLAAGTYDLVISNSTDNKSSAFDVRIAPSMAESYAAGTFASSTVNNHVKISGTIQSGTQNDVGSFGCGVSSNGDIVHVFNLGTTFDNVVKLKNTSTTAAVAKLYTYNNTTFALGSEVLPVPTSSGDSCVQGSSTSETTTYRLASAVSSTGYYAVVVKAPASSAYSFELIADASEETAAETYSGLAGSSLVGSYVELNGTTANRSADYATLPGGCAYGTPSAKQSDVRHIFRLNANAAVTVENVSNASSVSTVAALYSCGTDSTCATMTLVGGCLSEGSAATDYGTLSGSSGGTYYAVVVSAGNGENSSTAYGGYDGAYTLRIKALSVTAVESYTLSSNLNSVSSGRDVVLSGTTSGASDGALTAGVFNTEGAGTRGACVKGATGSNGQSGETEPDVVHTFQLGSPATLRVRLTKDASAPAAFYPIAALFSGTTLSAANLKTADTGGSSCGATTTGNATYAIVSGTDAVYNSLPAGTYTIVVTNGWGATSTGTGGAYSLELIAPDQESQGGAVACSNASTPKISNVTLAANSTYYVVAKAGGVGATNTGTFTIDVTRSTGSSSSSSTALVDCASCDGSGYGGGCLYDGGIGAQWTRLETNLAAGNYTAYIRPIDGSDRMQPKILIRDLGYLPKPYDQDESNSTYVPACQQESNGNAGIQKVFSDPSDPRVYTLGDLPATNSEGELIDYYLLLRGFSNASAPLDFEIALNDPNTTNVDANVSYCAGMSSDAEITQNFKAGTVYKAIVKGIGPDDAGQYNLTFGKVYDSNSTGDGVQESLSAAEGTPLVSYNGVDPNNSASSLVNVGNELYDRGVKVIGINTASGANSALVTAQLTTLANKTETFGLAGALVANADDNNLSSVVVQAVEDLSLSTTSDVTVKLVKYPDDPNGAADDFEFYVSAVEQPGTTDPEADGCPTRSDSTPNAAIDAAYGPDTHDACEAGALPRFVVTFKNPDAPNSVPCKCTVMPTHSDCKLKAAGGTWDGVSCVGWNMTLQLVANAKYVVEQIPVYIVTQDLMRPPDYDEYESTGSYWQDFLGDQCAAGERPDWQELEWSSSIPSAAGAQLAWDVCTGESLTDVSNCTDADYTRVATVRRYPMATTEADCLAANGYWEDSISSPQCQIIQGAECASASECGGGICSGGFCYWQALPLDLGSMLPVGTGTSTALRVKAVLNSSSDARSAPEVYRWAARYYCSGVE